MNIHGLDDPSLLVIFDQLSVEDLLRAGRVCSRWNFIRHKCALSRHSLTLLVGERARDRIEKRNVDNIPYVHLLTDDNEMSLVPVKKCEDEQNTIIRDDISSDEMLFIANLFSNVNNFTVSIQSDTEPLLSLASMLQVWSTDSKLTTLRLFTYYRISIFVDEVIEGFEKARPDLVRATIYLLSIINSMTSLRVLTLDIDSMLFNTWKEIAGYRQLASAKFRIVNKLERFYLSSCDFALRFEELADSLIRFTEANNQLKEIGIDTKLLMENKKDDLVKISPELAHRFTQMSLEFFGHMASSFAPFCELFLNLTTLQLDITELHDDFNPLEMFRPIASLTQLINLIIQANFEQYEMLNMDSEEMDFLLNQHQNDSVKVLQLRVLDRWNKNESGVFSSLLLHKLYPNVQVFILEQINQIPDEPTDSVVLVDMGVLKRTISLTTCHFKKLKMIKSINPDKEWFEQDLHFDESDIDQIDNVHNDADDDHEDEGENQEERNDTDGLIVEDHDYL